jgi:hypothetical protein
VKRSAIGILAILWLAPVLMSDGHRSSASAEQVERDLLAVLPPTLPPSYLPVAREYCQSVMAALNRVPCPNSGQRAVLTRSMRERILDVSNQGKLEAAELRTRLLDEVRKHSQNLARITTARLDADWKQRLREFDADVDRLKAGFKQVLGRHPGVVIGVGFRPLRSSCGLYDHLPRTEQAMVDARFKQGLEATIERIRPQLSNPFHSGRTYYAGSLTDEEIDGFQKSIERRLLIDSTLVVNPNASDLTDCVGLALATLFRQPAPRAPTVEVRCDGLRWQLEVFELLRSGPPPHPQLDPLICTWGIGCPTEMRNGSRFGYRLGALDTPLLAERRREHLEALEWAVRHWLSCVTEWSEGRFTPLQSQVAAEALALSEFGGRQLAIPRDVRPYRPSLLNILRGQRFVNPLFHANQNGRKALELEFAEILERGSVSPEHLRPGWQTAWEPCGREFIKPLADLVYWIHAEQWQREHANAQQPTH